MTLGGAAKGTMIAAVPTSITGGVMGNELVYVKEEGNKALQRHVKELGDKETEYKTNLEKKEQELKEKTKFTMQSDKGNQEMDKDAYAQKIIDLLFINTCEHVKNDQIHILQRVGKCAGELKSNYLGLQKQLSNNLSGGLDTMANLFNCHDEAQKKRTVDEMKNHLLGCRSSGQMRIISQSHS